MPPKQPVFAFLPLRSYGFRFIVQGQSDKITKLSAFCALNEEGSFILIILLTTFLFHLLFKLNVIHRLLSFYFVLFATSSWIYLLFSHCVDDVPVTAPVGQETSMFRPVGRMWTGTARGTSGWGTRSTTSSWMLLTHSRYLGFHMYSGLKINGPVLNANPNFL